MEGDSHTVKRAKQQAYRLLAYHSRTSSELRDRLQHRGYATAIIDEVLRQLAAEGYIDDRKLALEWARYRLQTKPMGRRRLSWELQKRGIPLESLNEVLRELYSEVDEGQLAEQAARRRLRVKGRPYSAQEQQQHARHLMSLGFEADIAAAALAAVYRVDDTCLSAYDHDLRRGSIDSG
jgi:regulatory protein